jgi:lipid-binding SYLF domain-containing protein
MDLKRSRKCLIMSLIATLLSLFPGQMTYGYEANPSRVETAARRSQHSAKTIRVVTGMPGDETIPAELFKRANAIGVFPDVFKLNLLFSQGMKGYGVICSRRPEGWSLPSYYAFGSTEMNLRIAGYKSFDLIVLFMNENTVNWFQDGAMELKGIKSGVAGPVGKLTREADRNTRGVNIIMYALIDGKLKGLNVESDFFGPAVINPDNHLNKALYGIKGREILQGKAPKLSQTMSDVAAVRDILNEKFPVTR